MEGTPVHHNPPLLCAHQPTCTTASAVEQQLCKPLANKVVARNVASDALQLKALLLPKQLLDGYLIARSIQHLWMLVQECLRLCC